MIYVFSSAYSDLYKQNVLNASCYPTGHVMRLRFDAKYVQESIRNNPSSIRTKDSLLVFAEGAIQNRAAESDSAKAGQLRDYQFLPIRKCVVSAAEKKADIFILDVKLGDFLDYQDGDKAKDKTWDEAIKKHQERPWPKNFKKSSGGDGFHVYDSDPLPSVAGERDVGVAWRSLVDRLNKSELRDCITYRVLGFYRLEKDRKDVARETPIVAQVSGADARYRFNSSEMVLLKVLLYGEANRQQPVRELNVQYDSKAFTSTSVSKIFINSHYNEERVLLACARTTEQVVTSLALLQEETTSVWSPQPSFIVEVAPKEGYLARVAVLLALSFFLANVSKFSDFGGFCWSQPLSVLDYMAKPVAALLFLYSSWLYLRKFPLK